MRELSLGSNSTIERLESPPTPLQFLRDYVSQNKPCIIKNVSLHHQWPAFSLWPHPSYLSKTLSSSPPVSVHLSPNGRADSLVTLTHPRSGEISQCFASAHVERLPFDEALQLVSNSKNGDVVAYLQQQNDCFRDEYSILGSDCDEHIAWATEALGCYPEAVNLWIGNQLSETSFHKDHYENLYTVVSGQKHFLLLPPTDVHRMYIRQYPAAHYSYSRVNVKWLIHFFLIFISAHWFWFLNNVETWMLVCRMWNGLRWSRRSLWDMCLGVVWILIHLRRLEKAKWLNFHCILMGLSHLNVLSTRERFSTCKIYILFFFINECISIPVIISSGLQLGCDCSEKRFEWNEYTGMVYLDIYLAMEQGKIKFSICFWLEWHVLAINDENKNSCIQASISYISCIQRHKFYYCLVR